MQGANDVPMDNSIIKKSIQKLKLLEHIAHAVPGSFHEQRPKWCPVVYNCFEQFPV